RSDLMFNTLFRKALTAGVALAALTLPALAEEAFPAKLAGHAFLPAFTLVAPPADAPRDALISGKFTGSMRNHEAMSVPVDVGAALGSHPSGISLPFIGQPVQGLSGFAMIRAEHGSIFVITDNGFGNKV